jgi:hypothetical protein
MKKLITLIVMSLMFLGCEESGPSAKATASAPSSEIAEPSPEPVAETPVENPAPIEPTDYIVFKSNSPATIRIVFDKLTDDEIFLGVDVFEFTTTSSEHVVDISHIKYRYRFEIIKQASASTVEFVLFKNSSQAYSLNMGSEFYIHAMY